MKLHTGDIVLVISGKDKGKTGTIMRVMPEDGRIVVSGINIRTRHVKKTPQQAGRILKYEAALSGSNVMILDPKTGKPARIGYKIDDKGKRTRISRISGEEVKAVKPKKEPKKATKGTEATEVKKAVKESKDAPTVAPAKKSPFWKKMGFGSQALEEQSEVKEGARSQQDHSVPAQQSQVHRSGGRGS